MSASLEIDDDRDTLRFERTIAHAPERVWKAVTHPAQLAHWFLAAVACEPRVGAAMEFDFGGEQGLDVYPGEVLELDPPRVFAFAWAEDVLRF
ncbi:MAG: SRPBCC domain-containing protein [Candidatus Dormibacteraeota bacterium]|uniref:SRPBCC domain-containing protein n=1 Tax=Candidatus Dormiibacter inghamiae TaxID=3127013 RepID=A0A934KJI5_9BACT|nr:SRPBCC domain-containing protein [Candidatus Dormibacteraeota bacterium]MBJ7606250.1 SRPBCC domain-containing protein [Candidatus Dormibacteraeota bacterium]